MGLSLHDRTILFLVILLDKTQSDKTVLRLGRRPKKRIAEIDLSGAALL